MLARKINGTWVLWDGKPFEHPLHPEWGPKWRIAANAEEFWSAQELLDAGLTKLIEVRPSFDPAAELLEGPVYTQNATSMTATWTKRAKTAQEIDAEKVIRIEGVSRNDLLTVILSLENDNRTIKAKINQLITDISASTAKFTNPQANQINMDQLKTGLKALLS